ncbi:TetR family transcriptional regulator [Paenactinomyces guangxiensis]|uniref:TetR/AcrR family transcriptional regulator n=1 Tax=Paenactinomyces guangxiensis TaxID=1490290 RepID=A0A7W1WU54_9BACL|nr:TetR family transcriptional regulator [Paenactinomyces guangxiensis]MBA4496105.1 TetR/AcrR family transcriptional regulator [Paenactinomyces guangxiensis]MBH8593193.1 TetR/AcrR family transcriptional regulator [Paenactinomyces guangxiensis]
MGKRHVDPKMKILIAAKKMFAKNGFEGTTVYQICKEAGVNVANVSYYFGGKENLFFALFDVFYPKDDMLRPEEQWQDPLEELCLIIEKVIRFKWEEPELAAIVQQEMTLQSPRLEGILQYTKPVWDQVRRILELGEQKGKFRFGSLDYTLLMVMGVVLFPKAYPSHQLLVTTESKSVEEVIECTLAFIMEGLKA